MNGTLTYIRHAASIRRRVSSSIPTMQPPLASTTTFLRLFTGSSCALSLSRALFLLLARVWSSSTERQPTSSQPAVLTGTCDRPSAGILAKCLENPGRSFEILRKLPGDRSFPRSGSPAHGRPIDPGDRGDPEEGSSGSINRWNQLLSWSRTIDGRDDRERGASSL